MAISIFVEEQFRKFTQEFEKCIALFKSESYQQVFINTIEMNKEKHRKFNNKNNDRVRRTERKVPSEPGLLILNTDGSNLTQWLEAMHRHLQKKYGTNGQFIETKELYVREIPSIQLLTAEHGNALSSAQIKDLHATYITNYAKNRDRDTSERVSIFGVIFECLSDEGSNMVREHKDWDDINR